MASIKSVYNFELVENLFDSERLVLFINCMLLVELVIDLFEFRNLIEDYIDLILGFGYGTFRLFIVVLRKLSSSKIFK